MLPKKYRLSKRGSYAYVYARGIRVGGDKITLCFIPSSAPSPRVGFSVNNKIGHAVVRNLVKRRMRSIIADEIPSLRGCQAIFIARKGIDELSFDRLRSTMKACLDRAGLRKS